MHNNSNNIGLGNSRDKQLQSISLDSVMEKRRLDQAMNAKEFAICAGVSYSTARSWFQMPGFPSIRGVVFWHDFVQWRAELHGLKNPCLPKAESEAILIPSHLPTKASQILHDS